MSPCRGGSEPHAVPGSRGPQAAVARGDPHSPPRGVALGSALQRHEAVHPPSPLTRPRNTLAVRSRCAQHPQPTLGDPGLAGNTPLFWGMPWLVLSTLLHPVAGRKQFARHEWAQKAAYLLGCSLEELSSSIFKHQPKGTLQRSTSFRQGPDEPPLGDGGTGRVRGGGGQRVAPGDPRLGTLSVALARSQADGAGVPGGHGGRLVLRALHPPHLPPQQVRAGGPGAEPGGPGSTHSPRGVPLSHAGR